MAQHYHTVQQNRDQEKLDDAKNFTDKDGVNARRKKDGKLKSGAMSSNGNGNDLHGD